MDSQKNKKENKEKIDWDAIKIHPDVVNLVPYEAARKYQIVPFEKKGYVVKIAAVDVDNVEIQNALKFLAEKNNIVVETIKVGKEDFKKVLAVYSTPAVKIQEALETISEEELEEKRLSAQTQEEKEEEQQLKLDAPIAKIVDVILRNAVEGGASDVHIEPMEDHLRVRFRLDGILHNSLILPKNIAPAVISRVKILANLKIDERRKPQDGRFRITEDKKQIDLRVSTFPTSMGEKAVLRILDKEKGVKELDDLGVGPRNLEIIKKTIFEPYGMILSTGPTGSGKSTTLYAILKILNREGVNIVTLEDPVEYVIEGVNQSQVKPEIGYDFASGLRSILRQDPDIIMVGEIRDNETAELAVHAALTGHVVLSTLHTNDSIGAIPRLLDMKIQPFLIASSLRLIMAQRLVRRICQNCKREANPSEEVLKNIKEIISSIPEKERKKLNINIEKEIKIYEGAGCPRCGQTGYKGRIGIFELFFMDEELSQSLNRTIGEAEILAIARRQGMITMKEDGIIKVLQGITTIEEVERVTEESFMSISDADVK